MRRSRLEWMRRDRGTNTLSQLGPLAQARSMSGLSERNRTEDINSISWHPGRLRCLIPKEGQPGCSNAAESWKCPIKDRAAFATRCIVGEAAVRYVGSAIIKNRTTTKCCLILAKATAAQGQRTGIGDRATHPIGADVADEVSPCDGDRAADIFESTAIATSIAAEDTAGERYGSHVVEDAPTAQIGSVTADDIVDDCQDTLVIDAPTKVVVPAGTIGNIQPCNGHVCIHTDVKVTGLVVTANRQLVSPKSLDRQTLVDG